MRNYYIGSSDMGVCVSNVWQKKNPNVLVGVQGCSWVCECEHIAHRVNVV